MDATCDVRAMSEALLSDTAYYFLRIGQWRSVSANEAKHAFEKYFDRDWQVALEQVGRISRTKGTV